MISFSEKEDFDSVLTKYGYTSDDFSLSPREDPYPAEGIGALTGEVIVRSSKSSIDRTYATGHGTAWVVAFEEDLRTGGFTR